MSARSVSGSYRADAGIFVAEARDESQVVQEGRMVEAAATEKPREDKAVSVAKIAHAVAGESLARTAAELVQERLEDEELLAMGGQNRESRPSFEDVKDMRRDLAREELNKLQRKASGGIFQLQNMSFDMFGKDVPMLPRGFEYLQSERVYRN